MVKQRGLSATAAGLDRDIEQKEEVEEEVEGCCSGFEWARPDLPL